MALTKEELIRALGDALAINVGGYVSKPLDDNVIYNLIPQLNPNNQNGLGEKAKYAKSAIYTGIGLLLEYFLGDKAGVLGDIGHYGAMLFYGISAGEGRDPVIYPAKYNEPTVNAPQYTVPVGQVIS